MTLEIKAHAISKTLNINGYVCAYKDRKNFYSGFRAFQKAPDLVSVLWYPPSSGSIMGKDPAVSRAYWFGRYRQVLERSGYSVEELDESLMIRKEEDDPNQDLPDPAGA